MFCFILVFGENSPDFTCLSNSLSNGKKINKSEVFLNLKNGFTECQTAFGSDSLP